MSRAQAAAARAAPHPDPMPHRLHARLAPPLLCLALCLAALPARAAFAIRSVTVAGRTCVHLADVARYYGLSYRREDDALHLVSARDRLRLRLDHREADCNAVTLHLLYAPLLHGGEALIAERDLTLLLDPILRDWGLPPNRASRIVLDPGHGGKDSGAQGQILTEKSFNLAIAQRAAAILRNRGYRVSFTRTSNRRFVSLSDRARIAADHRADLFVSIHANATGARTVSGIETFVLAPAGTPTHSGKVSPTPVPGNRHDRCSARLGYEIHRHLLAATNAQDRGLKHERFLVLKQAPCPAVLVETGFLSNAAEERTMASDAYQHRLAVGIVNGIIAFHRAQIARGRR